VGSPSLCATLERLELIDEQSMVVLKILAGLMRVPSAASRVILRVGKQAAQVGTGGDRDSRN
jgi:hypothetical protein